MNGLNFSTISNLTYCSDINCIIESDRTSSVILGAALMSTAAVIILVSLTVCHCIAGVQKENNIVSFLLCLHKRILKKELATNKSTL